MAGKVLARVMLVRLTENITERILPESQCSFRKDRSTSDMIFVLCQLQEKAREQNKDLFIAFIDLAKAFDTIDRQVLWVILEKFGVPTRFLDILHQFHVGMQACVIVGISQSPSFPVQVGVKQGCVLAPVIFNLFLAAVTLLSRNSLSPTRVSAYSFIWTRISLTSAACKPSSRPPPSQFMNCNTLMTVPS